MKIFAALAFTATLYSTSHADGLPAGCNPADPIDIFNCIAGQTNVAISTTTQSLGNLNGDDLVNKVTAILTPACPEPVVDGAYTSCSTDPLSISVGLVDPSGNNGGGTVVLTIQEGNYITAPMRDGMLSLFVQTLKAAASGKNCQSKNVAIDCEPPNTKIKGRSPIGPLQGAAPNSDCTHGQMTICSGPSNVVITVDEKDGGNQLAILNIDISFIDPDIPFNCDGILQFLGLGLVALPGLDAAAAGAASAVIGAITPCCADGAEGCSS